MAWPGQTAPHDWLAPDWPAPAGVHAVCTTRQGGASLPPFDSLNLGSHVGDDVGAVLANRGMLQSALQAHTPGGAGQSGTSQSVAPVAGKAWPGDGIRPRCPGRPRAAPAGMRAVPCRLQKRPS